MDKITGYVEHIIFRNAENGYTVLNLVSEGKEIVCTGLMDYIDEGEAIEAEGDFANHAIYGEQFQISRFSIRAPEDAESMARYLGSGAIKGVGAALAQRIVKKFGADTFRIMEEEPERLAEVKGISERKAREIAAQAADKKELRSAMMYLQKYGISTQLSMKIYAQYKERMYQILEENPYRMADDIAGVGFKIADEIAMRAGIHTDSDFRIRSGILYVLQQAVGEGHVYLPMELLLARAAGLLGVAEEHISPHISNLAMDKKLIIKQNEAAVCVYAASYYYLELNCARMLLDLYVSDIETEEHAQSRLAYLEKQSDIMLEGLQRDAVIGAVRNGIFIITGGPGTGKTTTINMIIKYFAAEEADILLAAPTGRAAKRMTEATGYEARTIHRMLELNGAPEDGGGQVSFERNEQNPLEADVIIIDEMSMVDAFLFQALLKAILPGTRLILVGDVNQLPSVGAGAVLRDIIASEKFPVVMLKKIFRQAEKSDIVVNAHKINEGKPILLDNKSRDFFFLKRDDANVIIAVMIRLIREKLPRYVEAGPFDIQVLSPMRKGALGVERLNSILQQYLNPPDQRKQEKELHSGCLREGDKVMQVKNNYQLEWEVTGNYGIPIEKGLGVFNGDIGIVERIDHGSETLTVLFDECRHVTYLFRQLEELELAYAITIHKSQGSEYPAVIMPVLSGPRLLMSRNLLYTGVTRAKKCVTLIGSPDTVMEMIGNVNERKRFTSLAERIADIVSQEMSGMS